jgi:hypothetical protein
MELRVNNSSNDTRRAARLLRWYPPAWRERYGEEFTDHLEQEFSDRPIDLKRGLNVAYKGLVARIGDTGLSSSDANPVSQTRAALGTSLAFIALIVVIMLDLWSRAMLAWSGRRYHPIPVSATTGILTVAMGFLAVVLAAVVLAVAVLVALQILRGRARRLTVPSIVALASAGFLLYAARIFPNLLAPYMDGAHGLHGMALSHPGTVITNLAQVTWELTQRWVAPWSQIPSQSTIQTVIDDCVPLAMFAFGIAIALLIRRIELPTKIARLVFPTVALLSVLSGVYFIAYLAWSVFGGPSSYEYFFPERRWLGIVYLILLALVPLLAGRSVFLARRNQPRRQHNHIEIIGSTGANSIT